MPPSPRPSCTETAEGKTQSGRPDTSTGINVYHPQRPPTSMKEGI